MLLIYLLLAENFHPSPTLLVYNDLHDSKLPLKNKNRLSQSYVSLNVILNILLIFLLCCTIFHENQRFLIHIFDSSKAISYMISFGTFRCSIE